MSQIISTKVAIVPIKKAEAGSIASIRMYILLLIFVLCVSVSSCGGPKTTLLAESRSPDGKMIARAYRNEPSGIGTGEIGTLVNLNWAKGSQSATTILVFNDGLDEPAGDKNVGINWLTPAHLELTYKGPRHLDFQAIKCFGIDISVRDLSSGASQTKSN